MISVLAIGSWIWSNAMLLSNIRRIQILPNSFYAYKKNWICSKCRHLNYDKIKYISERTLCEGKIEQIKKKSIYHGDLQ